MKYILTVLFACFSLFNFAQKKNAGQTDIQINSLIDGTLFSPAKTDKKTKLLILVAGSGPTDRNGNQKGGQRNSYKYLAEALTKEGIAVFTFDKRMFAQLKANTLDEKTIRFDDGIVDVKDVIAYFKLKKQYAKIIVAGHSEGALVGMVAADGHADGYISIAGAGTSIDKVLLQQIGKQAPTLLPESAQYLALLKKGETFELKNQMLSSVFRESVQPYMISWIKYDPQTEIKKLKIPVLLINGTVDVQVAVTEAEILKAAKPEASLIIIPNMNHVLKEIKGDNAQNMASYNDPALPVMPELVAAVNQFIKTI